MSERLNRPGRHEPVFPNTGHVARREYRELVRSRLFHVSTVTLAVLAIIVALIPIATRLAERGSVTRVAVVSADPALAHQAANTLSSILNQSSGGGKFEFSVKSDEAATCKRRASAGQRAKMTEYRAWFHERRRPPRG